MTDRVTLTEMYDLADREARRIRGLQDALVRQGHLDEPHAGKMREAEIHAATADLLARLIPMQGDLRAMLARRDSCAEARR